jgi:glycosyltransferase involved in cell wall biosynthesis
MNLTRAEVRVDGINAAIRRLATAQEAAGADVVVVTRASYSHLGELRRAMAMSTLRPDVVHFHSSFRPMHALMARHLARLRVPYVVSPHSALAPLALERRATLKQAYAAAVERRHIRGAAAAMCLTDVELGDLRTFVPEFSGPEFVTPNPVDADIFDGARWAPTVGRPKVVTLCRYDVRHKGLDRLADLARRCRDVDFVVYGEQDKNEPALTEHLRRTAPPNFALEPPVFGAAKHAALSEATMFVLTSRWEGLSLSLAEAMAAGVPCAVSREVAGTLPFEGSGLGLVLDHDPNMAAAQLTAALDDQDALHRWSRAGAGFASRAFEPRMVAGQTLAAYGEVIARQRRRPVAI